MQSVPAPGALCKDTSRKFLLSLTPPHMDTVNQLNFAARKFRGLPIIGNLGIFHAIKFRVSACARSGVQTGCSHNIIYAILFREFAKIATFAKLNRMRNFVDLQYLISCKILLIYSISFHPIYYITMYLQSYLTMKMDIFVFFFSSSKEN